MSGKREPFTNQAQAFECWVDDDTVTFRFRLSTSSGWSRVAVPRELAMPQMRLVAEHGSS